MLNGMLKLNLAEEEGHFEVGHSEEGDHAEEQKHDASENEPNDTNSA